MGWTRTNPDVVAVVGPFSPFFKQPHQSERHIVMASCRGALGLHDVCPREIADPTQWNASRSCSWTEKKFKDAGPLIAITTAPHSCFGFATCSVRHNPHSPTSKVIPILKFPGLRTQRSHQHTNTSSWIDQGPDFRRNPGPRLASPKQPGRGHGFSLARPVNNA